MPEARTAPPQRQMSEESLRRLRSHLGELNTATLQRLDSALPWYRQLAPDDRSSLGLLAQRGLTGFLSWFQRPSTTMSTLLSEVFGGAPTELARVVSLQKALQLIRTAVDVVETLVPGIVVERDQALVRESVLRYSREIAFALADVYARAAAVGWSTQGQVMVMAGAAPSTDHPDVLASLRRRSLRTGLDLLVGVQSDRLLIVAGGVSDPARTAETFVSGFGPGPVVYGPLVDLLTDAHHSAREALAGLLASRAWPRIPRPASAQDLLPERALQGDPTALETLRRRVFEPLESAGTTLLETVETYCELGHSLEGTARELFVHANTVRYRLRRVSEVTGWDPLIPRDAYVLQTALAAGRLHSVAHRPSL